jgi:hypothetical protein
MTSRLNAQIAVVAQLVAVAGAACPHSTLQLSPSFQVRARRLPGEWRSRDLQREAAGFVPIAWPSTKTVRLAVEVFRTREPTGAPLACTPRHRVASSIRCTGGLARSQVSLHRDIVIYIRRRRVVATKLCPAYDSAADAALTAARRACIAELDAQGIDRRAYSTAASAADLIDLRHALGYTVWDVYAASYGARLAQEAMSRDGSAIHSVVLASPVARSFSTQAEQPLSTQRALEHMFAACGRQPTCRDAFPNVEQDFYTLHTIPCFKNRQRSPSCAPIAGATPSGSMTDVSSTTSAISSSVGHAWA